METSNEPQLGHRSLHDVQQTYLRIPSSKTNPTTTPRLLSDLTQEELLAVLDLALRTAWLHPAEVQEVLNSHRQVVGLSRRPMADEVTGHRDTAALYVRRQSPFEQHVEDTDQQ